MRRPKRWEPLFLIVFIFVMIFAVLGAAVMDYSKLAGWILVSPFLVFATCFFVGGMSYFVRELWRDAWR